MILSAFKKLTGTAIILFCVLFSTAGFSQVTELPLSINPEIYDVNSSLEKSIKRELLAVNQEHNKNIENDGWRSWFIFKKEGNQNLYFISISKF